MLNSHIFVRISFARSYAQAAAEWFKIDGKRNDAKASSESVNATECTQHRRYIQLQYHDSHVAFGFCSAINALKAGGHRFSIIKPPSQSFHISKVHQKEAAHRRQKKNECNLNLFLSQISKHRINVHRKYV